jgi:hypothetical protein
VVYRKNAWVAVLGLLLGVQGVSGSASAEEGAHGKAGKAKKKSHASLVIPAKAQTEETPKDEEGDDAESAESAEQGTEPGAEKAAPGKTAATKDAERPATDETPRKVTGDAHMEVKARDLRLSDANTERLKRIAARYHAATHKKLVVTGGTRTPLRQARLMFDKLKHGDDIVALYENKQAATEIRDAYRDAVARKLGRKATIQAMREVIDAQITRGLYVSKHLRSGAVDVRSWGMSGELEKALKEAVKAEAGVTMMDERGGVEPHFHLSMPASS